MDAESLARLDKAQLIELVLKLEARIAALEARLGGPPKTPSNSSLPPSTAEKPNRAERRRQKRKGRPGVARELSPNPDHVRDIYAKACTGCGTALSEADQPDVAAYDHIELPPIRPVTTRVNLHRGACPCCGKRVAAAAPADMPPGSPFGPGIVALRSSICTPAR